MYAVAGARETLRSLLILAQDQDLTTATGQPSPPRERVQAALAGRGALLDTGPRPEPVFTFSGQQLAVLAGHFPLAVDERAEAPRWRQEACEAGWVGFTGRDSTLTGLLDLVVRDIFTTATSRSGSMSERRAVGAMWIAPGQEWTVLEVEEAYLHESTHSFLFADELVYGHFRAGADAIRVPSSIRREPREMPATVHSALVATELLSWRKQHDVADGDVRHLHGPSRALAAGALESLDRVLDDKATAGHLTDRMKHLASTARGQLRTTAMAQAG